MKKPEKSEKRKKAALKRGKKRSDRLKKTQAAKHVRINAIRHGKKAEERKFQNYLHNLMPDQE